MKDEARKREDYELLRRISGFDLFSCEAKYHPTWRRSYINKPESWQLKDNEKANIQAALEAAHKDTFERVGGIVNDPVIERKKNDQTHQMT